MNRIPTSRWSADRGVISAFVVGLVMAFIVCAGLGVDGGRLVATQLTLADHAENAARIGAQELTDLRSGSPIVDEQTAFAAAKRYLSRNTVNGNVITSSSSITVTVTRELEMTILKLFGARSHLITVTRRAEPRDR